MATRKPDRESRPRGRVTEVKRTIQGPQDPAEPGCAEPHQYVAEGAKEKKSRAPHKSR